MQDNFAVSIQLLLKAATAGTPHHEAVLTVFATTPQYLLDAGFPALPIVIKGVTVDKCFFDHGITKGMLERLPAMITTPKALYRSATHPDTAVVVAFETKDGSPLLVPVQPNRQTGRGSYNHVIASVYAKEPMIETRWTANGLLLWKA